MADWRLPVSDGVRYTAGGALVSVAAPSSQSAVPRAWLTSVRRSSTLLYGTLCVCLVLGMVLPAPYGVLVLVPTVVAATWQGSRIFRHTMSSPDRPDSAGSVDVRGLPSYYAARLAVMHSVLKRAETAVSTISEHEVATAMWDAALAASAASRTDNGERTEFDSIGDDIHRLGVLVSALEQARMAKDYGHVLTLHNVQIDNLYLAHLYTLAVSETEFEDSGLLPQSSIEMTPTMREVELRRTQSRREDRS